MKHIISKVQYKNFEPGEFIAIQERTIDEVLILIANFPWLSEREKIIINLTNPSITLEDENGCYLKLALFFNAKFVLHYLDSSKALYTKSFVDLKDANPYLKLFFESDSFDTNDFKKDATWGQNNLIHFATQDFKYILTPKSIRSFLIATSGLNFLMTFVSLGIVFYKGIGNIPWPATLLLVFSLFIAGGGINLLFFYSYYTFAKNKILIMSKGNDVFYFGEKDNPNMYNKNDISIVTIKSGGGHSILSSFGIVTITFKDGISIQIPNILVSHLSVENKLSMYTIVRKTGFPSLKSRSK